MGRRKIEIRAIKDDRNRSVTFLKRKGGLFKKAHELSVLCSVDVAVIIFGHNKKLYEFSSGDINETLRKYQYYGPPHEHKGPADFKNKGGGGSDDDDDEEDEPQMPKEEVPPPHMMPQSLPHHNSFQHIHRPGSSASPPMPNGLFQPPRNGTPNPQQVDSRPSSRNTIRRPSSNLVPMQHPPHATPPPPPQNGFAYTPNPPIYHPQAPPQPSPQPPYQQQFQHQQHTPQPPHQQLPPQPPYAPESQHQHAQPGPPRTESLHPPSTQLAPRSSPQPPQPEFRATEHMTPPKIQQLSKNSRSIFTPIDEGGSVLAQHFFGAPDPPRHLNRRESPPTIKPPPRGTATHPPAAKSAPLPPRSSSNPSPFRPPTRSDTGGSKSGARPKLNLTIPSEASDDEESASPGHKSAVTSANPAREGHHGIVLPPPSPSASAVLSAGASGPPNPFARPAPPTSNATSNAFDSNRNQNLETPVSALPSRYMDNRDLLASPGGLFGGSMWDSFAGNSNILPSPNIATPAEARLGPNAGWARHDQTEKRQGEDLNGENKRLKT